MLPPETVRSLVEQAVLAPSSHNSQPWRFVAGAAAIDVWADRARALPVNDPDDRELVISCGAAAFSLRVAAAFAGLGTVARAAPEGSDADWLVRVEFTGAAADAELSALAAFLAQRRTFCRAFDARPVAREAVEAVQAAVAQEGASLLSLEGEQRRRAGELVAEGDRLQWEDARWRRELAMWMHPRRRGDGLAVPALAAPITQAVVRTFDMGDGVAARDQQLVTGSPWLAVLTTPQDDTPAWLCAGQALQRALLVACRFGLQASYLNQPVEVAQLRPLLQALSGTTAHPQLLIRWGYTAQALPASARRPVDAVLELPGR